MLQKINPDQYLELFEQKTQRVLASFSELDLPQPDLLTSPPLHFRMRAEFRLWHERQANESHCFYAMFDPAEPKKPIRIDEFPIVSKAISDLMQPLLDAINENLTLNRKLFQVEFLSSTAGEVVVTLIYHRQLDEAWQVVARELETRLSISIIGRARKQKIVISRDFVFEEIEVDQHSYRYEQKENSFTQPNAYINQCMINWVDNYLTANIDSERHSLLEMYCGNGNFSIPLARHFRKVLATEISKTSIASARNNANTNQIDNIHFVRLSGEETAEALDGSREFRRLRDIDLDQYQFTTVLVDPPRSGLDDQTLRFIQRFDEIIYISCNPETLEKNLARLSPSYTIQAFALFDQFPYTHHCECGAILKKMHDH